MTQQYIAGQVSALLGDLELISGGCPAVVRDLRRDVEHSSLERLPRLAREAFKLLDTMCWAVLEEGDLRGFGECAKAAAALGELADNAGLRQG